MILTFWRMFNFSHFTRNSIEKYLPNDHRCQSLLEHGNEIDVKTSFYQHSLQELQELFGQNGLAPSGPGLLFNWHYKKRKTEPCHVDLAKKSIAFVAENFHFDLPQIDTIQASTDKIVKFLYMLHDGQKVE